MPLGEECQPKREGERGAYVSLTSTPCVCVSLQRSPEGATN